jgi:hypothetical protein
MIAIHYRPSATRGREPRTIDLPPIRARARGYVSNVLDLPNVMPSKPALQNISGRRRRKIGTPVKVERFDKEGNMLELMGNVGDQTCFVTVARSTDEEGAERVFEIAVKDLLVAMHQLMEGIAR